MKRNTFIFITVVFLFASQAYALPAWFAQPRFFFANGFRKTIDRDHRDLFISRASMMLQLLDKDKNSIIKFTPFVEVRRNFDLDIWERREAGFEVGRDFSPWFYLGITFQKVYKEEDYRYYINEDRRDKYESELRFLLSHKLISTKNFNLRGFLLNEYTYGYNRNEGTRNEVAIGVAIPIGKHLETSFDWRHIDRIHYYDSDTFESFVTLIF